MTGKAKPTKKNPPIRSLNRLKENKSNVARKESPVKIPTVAKVAKVAKAKAVSTKSVGKKEGRKRVKKKRRSITDTVVGNRDHINQTPIYRYLPVDTPGIGSCFECQKCGPIG